MLKYVAIDQWNLLPSMPHYQIDSCSSNGIKKWLGDPFTFSYTTP